MRRGDCPEIYFFIYTDSCDKELAAKTKSLYSAYGKTLIQHADMLIPTFAEIINMPHSALRWFVAHFILLHATYKMQSENSEMPTPRTPR
ncbi:MAG: hypothetical protein FWC32_00640 [Firmicutes bacterium]|nr:hypothetical protein [Bacillota bacterium]